MATNFGIKIDLLKLKGAFMRNLKGQTATAHPTNPVE